MGKAGRGREFQREKERAGKREMGGGEGREREGGRDMHEESPHDDKCMHSTGLGAWCMVMYMSVAVCMRGRAVERSV